MIILLSPAKSLNPDPDTSEIFTEPRLLSHSQVLVDVLRKKSQNKLQKLMSISPELAKINKERYEHFQTPFTSSNAKPAIHAFAGDVYVGLDAGSLDSEDIKWAQDHLRILSGLYGVLRPLDLMQDYRLEMGTRLKTRRGSNLYQFWKNRITDVINEDVRSIKSNVILNLASKEYFQAIRPKNLQAILYHVNFFEKRKGKYQFISFTAKKARGWMCRYVIENRIEDPEKIKNFSHEGFNFNPELSTERELIFTKDD